MKRTKAPTTNENQLVARAQKLTAMSELVNRAVLAQRLGNQYSNDRDLYAALGWNDNPKYEDYRTQYKRQDIAKAIIDRPIEDTWKDGFEIIEVDDKEESEFEKQWKDIAKTHKIDSKFQRVDKLTALGKYGILLLGFDDVQQSEDMKRPVQSSVSALNYVKPFAENHATIKEWEKDTSSARFGLPTTYEIRIQNPGVDTETILLVHHSRVLHVTGELLESEVEGVPELEVVLNRLYDLEKIVGGSAEMFWRGARPGYQAKIDDDFKLTPEMEEDLEVQLNEFEHNLRRMLVNEGISWQALEQQLADPKGHVDVQIEMISAAKKIPKRMLTGSERGELASTEDKSTWNDHIEGRRNNHAELHIVRPFIDRLIEYGIMPEVKKNEDYTVMWSDLWAPSDKEKAEIGKTRSEALANYVKSPVAMNVVPPKSFYEYFLNLDPDQVDIVMEERDGEMNDEDSFFNQTGGNGQTQQIGEVS